MLDPVIHQATRLQILALIHRNREVSFNEICRALDLTEGNLGAHAERLVEADYVEASQVLAGVRFEKRYRLTRRGKEAFRQYRDELARLLTLDAGSAATRTTPSDHAEETPR